MDMASWGTSAFGVIMFLLALPVLLAWPFWLLAKLCGMPWKVVTEREGEEVGREKVKGWRASGRRIDEIVAGLRNTGTDEGAGVELRDSSGVEPGDP
ncbi:MAG: hypothetical protein K0R68_1022 [Mycobacterium sp.]|jgi:hypothetical protein|nr:hypothetical protein [Mycobacterium sp.]